MLNMSDIEVPGKNLTNVLTQNLSR
uniref:Uncharacterized protein n=1 Tax=Anguilla anguilla TaxID=7936 RepID=A0A0E9U403_ANGAN